MDRRAWRQFHRASSVQASSPAAPRTWLPHHHKCYRRFEHVRLPASTSVPAASLATSLAVRRTGYDFARRVDADSLSLILRLALHGDLEESDAPKARAYPSAGALYPVELYILAPYSLGTELSPGAYHYCFPTRQLEVLDRRVTGEQIDVAFGQSFSLANATTIVLTAAVERSYRKYLDRGYRYALLEAGHIAQSICLVAATTGLSAAPLGGFIDRQLVRTLHLRHELEVPIYAVALG